MIDLEREVAEGLILDVLRSLRGGAEIVIRPDGGGRAAHLQYPPPSGLFGGCGVRDLLPVPPSIAPETSASVDKGKEVATARPDREQFRKITWPGLGEFVLNAKQAAVVRELYEAWQEDNGPVKETYLLEVARKAGSDVAKLRDLFRHTKVWGTLILYDAGTGFCQLAPLPSEDRQA